MSTYTDLRNRIKEPITVNYNDRVTMQAISALNPNNEFHGRFSGTFVGEKHVTGETLSAVQICNSVLSGAYVDVNGERMPVENIATDVSCLKNTAFTNGETVNARHVGYDSIMDLFRELGHGDDFQLKQNSVYRLSIDKSVPELSSAFSIKVGCRLLCEDDFVIVKNEVRIADILDGDVITTNVCDYVRKSDLSAIYVKLDEVLPGEFDESTTYEVSAIAKAMFTLKDAFVRL